MPVSLFSLAERVALVTGGNGGLGLAMARGLAEAGAHVAVTGRDETKNLQAERALEGRGIVLHGRSATRTPSGCG